MDFKELDCDFNLIRFDDLPNQIKKYCSKIQKNRVEKNSLRSGKTMLQNQSATSSAVFSKGLNPIQNDESHNSSSSFILNHHLNLSQEIVTQKTNSKNGIDFTPNLIDNQTSQCSNNRRPSILLMENLMNRINKLDDKKRKIRKYMDEIDVSVQSFVHETSHTPSSSIVNSAIFKINQSPSNIRYNLRNHEIPINSYSILSHFNIRNDLYSDLDIDILIKNISNSSIVPESLKSLIKKAIFSKCIFTEELSVFYSNNCSDCNKHIIDCLNILNKSLIYSLQNIFQFKADKTTSSKQIKKGLYNILIIVSKCLFIDKLNIHEEEVLLKHLLFYYIDSRLKNKSFFLMKDIITKLFMKKKHKIISDFPFIWFPEISHVGNNFLRTNYVMMLFYNRPLFLHPQLHIFYDQVLENMTIEIIKANELILCSKKYEKTLYYDKCRSKEDKFDKNMHLHEKKSVIFTLDLIDAIYSHMNNPSIPESIMSFIMFTALSLMIISFSLNKVIIEPKRIVKLHTTLKLLFSNFRDSIISVDHTIIKDKIFCLIYMLETSYNYFDINHQSFLAEDCQNNKDLIGIIPLKSNLYNKSPIKSIKTVKSSSNPNSYDSIG